MNTYNYMSIYTYNNTNNYTIIPIMRYVYLYEYLCMNTLYNMENEMDFFYRCKKLVYSHDFVIFF